VGGLLLAATGWRSIFLVDLPLCVLSGWFTWRVSPRPPRTQSSARSLDLPGQLLAAVALGSLIAAMIEPRPRGFFDPLVALGFFVAGLAAAAFVWVESRSRAPMLPLPLFRAPNFSPAVLYGVAINATYYGTVFVVCSACTATARCAAGWLTCR
jgi:DHA2 family methylenomycin A resistance protein-like MFS transporter